ncbi:hypothetical protein D3C77_271920 [compost metagenome]
MKIFSDEEWNDEQNAELDALEQKMRQPLRKAVKSFPTQEENAALIDNLQAEFNMLRSDQLTNDTSLLPFNIGVKPPSIMGLIRNQFRLNRKYLLLAGSSIFLMLILVIDPTNPEAFMSNTTLTSLFAIIIPLLIILSMLFSFRSWDSGMRALESITPYPPVLVIYCRMLMVIGLIISWATVSSIVATIRVSVATEIQLPWWPFILQWLGISLVIGGISMIVMFHKGSKYALVVSSVVYGLWLFMTVQLESYGYRVGQWLNELGVDMSIHEFNNHLLLGLGIALMLLAIYKSFSYTSTKHAARNSF